MSAVFYKAYLKRELEKRCRKNRKYSLRSFAKFLGVDSAIISKVLSDQSSLGLKSAEKIMDALQLSDKQRNLFLESLSKEKAKGWKKRVRELAPVEHTTYLEQDAFRIISDWYHYAILELSLTKSFAADEKWISRALGIGLMETRFAIDRLKRLGLLQDQEGIWRKATDAVTTRDRQKTSRGLKQFHAQVLDMAKTSLHQDPIEERSFFGITIAANPDNLPVVRNMLEEYAKHICGVMETGEQKRVYQLEIGLFPLQKEGF